LKQRAVLLVAVCLLVVMAAAAAAEQQQQQQLCSNGSQVRCTKSDQHYVGTQERWSALRVAMCEDVRKAAL
jgi:hypothetical protein